VAVGSMPATTGAVHDLSACVLVAKRTPGLFELPREPSGNNCRPAGPTLLDHGITHSSSEVSAPHTRSIMKDLSLVKRWHFLAAARWFARAVGSPPDAQVAAHNLNALASALLYYIFLGVSGLRLVTTGFEGANPAARSWTASVVLVGLVVGAAYAIRELPRTVRV